MAFQDVVFPASIAVGVAVGRRRQVDIVEARSGVEDRNLAHANSRRRYTLTVPPESEDVQDALTQFWEGRRGAHKSFPVKDPADHKSCAPSASPAAIDQTLGTGDGAETEFQLVKVYEPSGPDSYTRKVTKPIVATVKVSLDDVEQASGWSVARLTGIVTFDTAPGAGVVVKAGYEYHVPVRFESLEIVETILFQDSTLARDGVAEFTDVTLIEALGE